MLLSYFLKTDSLNLHSETPGWGTKSRPVQAFYRERFLGSWTPLAVESYRMTWFKHRNGSSRWQHLGQYLSQLLSPGFWRVGTSKYRGQNQCNEISGSLKTEMARMHICFPILPLLFSFCTCQDAGCTFFWLTLYHFIFWPLSTFLIPDPLHCPVSESGFRVCWLSSSQFWFWLGPSKNTWEFFDL